MKSIPSRNQWKNWTLGTKAGYLGAWFGGLGLVVTLILMVVPERDASSSMPPLSPRELEFDQLLYQVNEQVHKPFEKWLRPSPGTSLDCNDGSRIATRALELAEKIEAFDTGELASYRPTRAMAKHEYLAMLYCWAAAIADACKDKLPDGNSRVIPLARRVLAEYDKVSAMRRDLFAQDRRDSNLPRLRDVAKDIENITTWYAGLAASVLYFQGDYDFKDAYRLAHRAIILYPDEHDPWMDQVRSMHLDANAN